tara:strand:- start:683 stop:1078 length:396 start_codon:yes stop_codon:yes gene_type:complete
MFISILLYAAIGVTLELIFNAIRCKTSWSLKGSVSIWMLPIYGIGLTYGFDLIQFIMTQINSPRYIQWLTYPLWVWAVEIVIGLPTRNKLWDYSLIKYNWRGVISLKHYPAWLIFGVIIEHLRMYTDPILL